MKNIIKITFVIIATLVGAGFASGKEIYSFFFVYGVYGIIGVFISSLLISFVTFKVLKICYKNNIDTFEEFCQYIIKNNFKKLSIENVEKTSDYINKIINILLLVTFYIMISGFSSFLHQEFFINKYLGSIAIVFLCYIAFQKNIEYLIKISDYLVPILIGFIFYISSKNLNIIESFNNSKNINNCFIECSFIIPLAKAVLYGSYNCILLIPVLVSVRKIINKANNILGIFILAFTTIAMLSMSVYNILLLGNNHIYMLEMPIISIVNRYGTLCKNAYLFLIASSIFTTAILTGCGFLNGCKKNNYKLNILLMCISAIFVSQISFSIFVELLYPVLGVLGVLEVIAILKSGTFSN